VPDRLRPADSAGQRELRLRRAPHRVVGVREHNEERVAAHLTSTMRGNRLPDEPVVLRDELEIPVAQPLEQPRRPGDVREQEGHRISPHDDRIIASHARLGKRGIGLSRARRLARTPITSSQRLFRGLQVRWLIGTGAWVPTLQPERIASEEQRLQPSREEREG
jgi:hypothetical protein